MGLKSQPEFSKTPEFEQQTNTTTETTTATKEQDKMNTTTTKAPDAAAQATTAIATAAASSALAVAKPAPKFAVAFADKCGVFDTSTVEGLSLAAPAIKGEQGSLFKGDTEIGEVAHLELISFNHRWVVGSGENDKEAKDFFRVSYDNKTISGSGASLQEYLESLIAQGFKKARISPYLDVWGFLVWTKKDGDIAVDSREIVRLQCSQTSLGAFTAFATTRGLLESRGLAQPIDVIQITAQKQTNKNGDKYTNFLFSVPAPK
jgi:hypothetical protein